MPGVGLFQPPENATFRVIGTFDGARVREGTPGTRGVCLKWKDAGAGLVVAILLRLWLLEHQGVGRAALGDWPVLGAGWNNEELAGVQLDGVGTVALDAKRPAPAQE